jgi:subtilase family serine protease
MYDWKNYIPVAIVFLWITGSSWSSAQVKRGEKRVRPPLYVQAQSQNGVVGLTPSEIRMAYGFDQLLNRGDPHQLIAVVVPFHDHQIEDDLALFSSTFGLPECTTISGCLRTIYATGKKPQADAIWALETALDVEWVHAIAPDARILLVEAESDLLEDVLDGVDVAVQQGASVVSMSWGAVEFAGELANDDRFVVSNVMFVAASGDTGAGTMYPAASPNVVAVGGTKLFRDSNGNYSSETAWTGSGGGLSQFEPEPVYQSRPPIPDNNDKRGVPDVAYNADPDTGFAVYSSYPVFGLKGWFQLGGTSAATPQWAALIAIANSSRRANGKAPLTGGPAVLYDVANAANYHDITTGTNGTCGIKCMATAGYDYVTGLGSPKAASLIPALVRK